jgi:hypothetical protein
MQDVLIQRLRGLVAETLAKECRPLHERLTELQGKLCRIEEAVLSDPSTLPDTERSEYRQRQPCQARKASDSHFAREGSHSLYQEEQDDVEILRDVDADPEPAKPASKNNTAPQNVVAPGGPVQSGESLDARPNPSVREPMKRSNPSEGVPTPSWNQTGPEITENKSPRKRTRLLDSVKTMRSAVHDVHADELSEDGAKKAFLLRLSSLVGNRFISNFLVHAANFIDWCENVHEPERTGFLPTLVNHQCFSLASLAAVLGDQGLTVWNADYQLANMTTDMPMASVTATYCLNCFFLIELLLKLALHRWHFFVNAQWKLNWLDFFLVAYSFLEELAVNLSFLRILRCFKVAKMVRMLKALTAFHDLRIMLDCLLGSFFGLFWSIVLIVVIMYIFALIFMQALTEYLITNADSLSPEIKEGIMTYFGSVATALLSVYAMLTGGLEWGNIYTLVQPAGFIAGPACIGMVAFFSVSVWNIITSVFIEKAMRLAQPSLRELVHKQKAQAKVDEKEVAQLIAKLDHDSDNVISKDEFVEICMDRDIQEFLAVRGLNIRNIRKFDSFFDMIAYRDTGSLDVPTGVSVAAVVEAFLHMKGQATAVDMNRKHYELFSRVNAMHKDLRDVRKMLGGKWVDISA